MNMYRKSHRQSSYLERFNWTYREKILSLFIFETLRQVRELTQRWLWVYNH